MMLQNEDHAATFCWRLVFFLTTVALAESTFSEADLLDHLFAKYNPDALPRLNLSEHVDVGIEFELRQIQYLDEKNEVLYSAGVIIAGWIDDFLKWNSTNYGGHEATVVRANKVWLPDFGIENSVGKVHDDTHFKYFRVYIANYGMVLWIFSGLFQTSCGLDITYYPFDSQTCKIRIKNWVYPENNVNLHASSGVRIGENYEDNGVWDVKATRAVNYQVSYDILPSVNFSAISYELTLHRKPLYYIVNVIIPCIFITAVTLLVYLLPPESGEKVSLGVTVLLAFSVFLFVIADSTPVTSESTPIIGIFIAVTMGMSTLSVITAVVVLRLHHHPTVSRPPAWIRKIVFRVLGKILYVYIPAVPGLNSVQQKSNQPLLKRDDRDAECKAMKMTNQHNQDTGTEDVKNYDNDVKAHLRRIAAVLDTIEAKQAARDADAAVMEEWQAVARVVDRLLFTITLFIIVAAAIWVWVVGIGHMRKQYN